MYKKVMAHRGSCLQTFKALFFILNAENSLFEAKNEK